MADEDTAGILRIAEREIPVPKHLSAQARAFLSMPRPPGGAGYPDLDDKDAWRAYVAAGDENILNVFMKDVPPFNGQVSDLYEGDALAYDIVPGDLDPDDRRVYLHIHGGALIMGSGEVCIKMSYGPAMLLNARVVAVDYRMPPDHPYPAGLDDCIAFYRALLRDYSPAEIIGGGGSAGGNLVAAMILRARDEGLPLPAAVVLISPEVDLTESGDTFRTNAGIDGMGSLMQANLLYAGGQDLSDPYISPLFGDFSKGFPPTFVTAGTRDLFLSNAVRMHRALRAAHIPAELHILEAAAHGAFAGSSPEEAELDAEMKSFCERIWSGR